MDNIINVNLLKKKKQVSSNIVHGPNDRLCKELTCTLLCINYSSPKRRKMKGYIIHEIKNTYFKVQLQN